MQPIKLLAKLTTKTLNLTGTNGGAKTIDSIDWTTAAHAMAGLPQVQTNWAYYRFVGDEKRLSQIVKALTMQITLFIKINRYRLKPETVNGLVMAAIYELIQPMCGECNGSGFINPNSQNPTECPVCHGHGRKMLSKRKRCKLIGIDHKSFTDRHDEVIKELMRIIFGWEIDIFNNIHEKMREAA